MQARAKLLSEGTRVSGTGEDVFQAVVFQLFPETFAIEGRFVREVLNLRDMTPIPGTPSYVMGMIHLRGRILSVWNLKDFFGLREQGLTEMNKLIVLSNGYAEFGIVADHVEGYETFFRNEILDPPSSLSKLGTEFFQSVTSKGIIMLNAEKLLMSEKFIVHDGTGL